MRLKGETDPRDRQTQKHIERNVDKTERRDRPDRQTDSETQRETEMRLKG